MAYSSYLRVTRWTARIALACYLTALALGPRSERGRRAWALGCGFFLAHAASAFHFYHGWSHAAAYADTAERTARAVGLHWGGGLYWNYAFGLVWLADVLWGGRPRPRWVSAAVHGYLGLLWFNAAVVFESGPIRWVTAAAALALAVNALSGRRPR